VRIATLDCDKGDRRRQIPALAVILGSVLVLSVILALALMARPLLPRHGPAPATAATGGGSRPRGVV
jgi:hypothetical protein